MWPVFISVKYFLSKSKEGMISLTGTISVAGVALGVASLIIVLSVMNGFDIEVREKITGTYAHIMVLKNGGVDDPEKLVSDIKSVPGVGGVSAFLTGQAILRKEDSAVGVILKGVDPEREPDVTDIMEYSGIGAEDLRDGTIIIGSELMRNEAIRMGDKVEVIVPHSTIDLARKQLKVVGAFTSGRYDYDSNIAVVNMATAAELFRTGGNVTGVGARLDDEMASERVKEALTAMLGYPYVVKSWMDLDKNLVTALALEKKMMFIILALIVMVACFNISGSLIMMVMERTRDIGILKALGANSRGVSMVFLVEGAVIGLLGIVTGALAGVFIAYRVNAVADLLERFTGITIFPNDVYYFTEIPVDVSASDVITVVSVALALTLAAGIYPAWKASRMDPVEAIRYE